VSALALAGVYALAALGFVIIYRTTGVFNFAQGQFMLIGAYIAWSALLEHQVPLWLAIGGAIVAGGLVGLAVYFGPIRKMTGQPIFAVVIVTMGVSFLVQSTVLFWWGPVPKYLPLPGSSDSFTLPGAIVISDYDVYAIAIALLCCAAFIVFFRFTSIGLQMQAIADNPLLAWNRGVNVSAIIALTWGLAGISAVIAGILYAGNTSVNPAISDLGLQAFPAALVGGFASVEGTLLGAVVIAGAETWATFTWGSDTQDVVAFGILLLLLLVRPYGLLGTRVAERV
jgi:branched-chain amino acid transport system permease protein